MDRLLRLELQRDNAVVFESSSLAANDFPPHIIYNATNAESVTPSSEPAHTF
jgi:hypothetical protein